VAYKNEGFEMFTGLMNAIWEEFGRYIFVVEVEVDGQNGDGDAPPQQQWAKPNNTSSTAAFSYAGGTAEEQPSALQDAADMAYDEVAEQPVQVETRTVAEEDRIGRNDPCWCGSGKKYKKCHGA
jgi:preprotein translocase subunit SecA